jgi:hypothetical protein
MRIGLSYLLLCVLACTSPNSGVSLGEILRDASPTIQLAGRDKIIFDLGERMRLTGVLLRSRSAHGKTSWTGRFSDTSGTFTIVHDGQKTSARVHIGKRAFDILQRGPGRSLAIMETTSRVEPLCKTRNPQSANGKAWTAIAMVTDPCDDVDGLTGDAVNGACLTQPSQQPPAVIDALIVYTNAVETAFPDVEDRIELSVEETNDAFSASGVPAILRIPRRGCIFKRKCIARVDFAETNSELMDLSALRRKDDEQINLVHKLRDQCRADVVLMIVQTDSYAGYSCIFKTLNRNYRPYAFAVVRATSAWRDYSFTHELGHMMGGGHDREDCVGSTDVRTGMCADSAGWCFTDGGVDHKSVMGQVSVVNERTPYFSNPDVLYGTEEGAPATGSREKKAMNAKTLRLSAPVVSTFR